MARAWWPLPKSIPIGVVALATGVDEPVVSRTARIDREDVPGSAVEERADHHADVVFRCQDGVAPDAEADDRGGVRILAENANNERLRTSEDPDRRAEGGRGVFRGLRLRERVADVCRIPRGFVQQTIDGDGGRGQRSGAQLSGWTGLRIAGNRDDEARDNRGGLRRAEPEVTAPECRQVQGSAAQAVILAAEAGHLRQGKNGAFGPR